MSEGRGPGPQRLQPTLASPPGLVLVAWCLFPAMATCTRQLSLPGMGGHGLCPRDGPYGKVPMGKEEKGTTEDEMGGWHHRLNGHEFE